MDFFCQTTQNMVNIFVHISNNMDVDFEELYK